MLTPEEEDGAGYIIKGDEETPMIKEEGEVGGEVEQEKPMHLPSMISIMAIGFIANVEYGIVMPSVWQFIVSLDGTNNTLGWALSGFSLAQLIFLPLIGFWADKRTLREAICVSLLVGISGNLVYAMSVSPLMIIAGRLIAGIGSANMALTNSYIASVSTKEQRTRYMAKVNGINAIGLVAGPIFNLALAKLNSSFWIKNVHFVFDPLRGPGWMLSVLLFLCLISFIFFKEPTFNEKQQAQGVETKSTKPTTTTTTQQQSTNNYSEKTHLLINNNNSNNNDGANNNNINNSDYNYNNYNSNNNNNQNVSRSNSRNDRSTPTSPITSMNNYSKKYNNQSKAQSNVNSISNISSASYHFSIIYGQQIQGGDHQQDLANPFPKREDTFFKKLFKLVNASLLTCFLINFVQNFVFGALETLITPITHQQYNFDTLDNSVMYSVISGEVIIFIFATVFAANKGIQDKYLILFGQVFLGAGLAMLLVFFGGPATRHVELWKFALSVIITTMGIPTQNTSIYSLYSKLLNRIYGENEPQGFQTGFMMLMGSGARILGPLLAGYGLDMANRFPLFIFCLSLWVFDIGVTLIFWKKLTFITKPGQKATIVAH
ncbi:hypothetical protein DFA_10721 [Cavenderia fasciculata]|uniref:Major facilitator superfamily (MFS) profile domain-containing protein n=1 Tax=Cavenderia fasciculata TaxID=261658 RepID=F4QB76_CACFS|nr:uncharacterized protein DFA_10721 [Cavenderia fasciculata]EGG14848.1 hypothetical protein DFA_10721 [Cavenderia fasciculata]|eukprot:XP_004351364.1 hypothetical protein DFA_10721 [Cavenderia fasciculata]